VVRPVWDTTFALPFVAVTPAASRGRAEISRSWSLTSNRRATGPRLEYETLSTGRLGSSHRKRSVQHRDRAADGAPVGR
jgi:hypothetical protein